MWSKEEIARVCAEQAAWYQDMTWPGAVVIAAGCFAAAFFLAVMLRGA